MTNGLTKLPQYTQVPGTPASPAIPATPERWYLSPPPPGHYYSFVAGEWVLKKSNAPATTIGGGSGASYTIPVNQIGSAKLRAGDSYRLLYRRDGSPDLTLAGVVPGGAFVLPTPSTPGWTLVSLTITPAGPTPGVPISPIYNVPAPALPIYFYALTYENGYPYGPGPYIGEFLVPRTTGGYDRVTRSYTKTGPNGLWVPTNAVDPPGVTTGATGIRAVRIDAFAGAPAVRSAPGTTLATPVKAWDAGANSIEELDGDLYVKYQVPYALGARVGFFQAPFRDSTSIAALLAGFYTYSTAQGMRWSIVDHGRQVVLGNNVSGPATEFEIRRVGDQVTYYVDGELVWRPPNPLTGMLRVGTVLYGTGDMVL